MSVTASDMGKPAVAQKTYSLNDIVEVQSQLAKRTKRQLKQESSSSIFVKQMILSGRATAKGRMKVEEK